MRQRAWAAWASFVVGMGLAVTAEFAGGEPLRMAAGLLIAVAIVLGLSLLPFWSRMRERVPAMPDLFVAVGPDERWCDRCGRAAAREGPCAACGHVPKQPRPKRRTKEGTAKADRAPGSKRGGRTAGSRRKKAGGAKPPRKKAGAKAR